MRIRHRNEWRVDAGEQHGECERLALWPENSARAPASQYEGGSVLDIGQHAVTTNGGAAGAQGVEPFAFAVPDHGVKIIHGDRIDECETDRVRQSIRA